MLVSGFEGVENGEAGEVVLGVVAGVRDHGHFEFAPEIFADIAANSLLQSTTIEQPQVLLRTH